MTHSLYMGVGWREVDTLVLDLTEWAGMFNGYGLYGTSILIRKPGEFKRSQTRNVARGSTP